MTHDFARQRAARATRAAKPPTPPWLWFVSGLVTGTLCSFLVYLATLAPRSMDPAIAAPPVAEASSNPAGAVGPPAEKPKFDFYTILPESGANPGERPAESGVATKKPEATPPKPEPQAQPPGAGGSPAKPAPTEVPEPQALLLQAGSFRQFGEADRRRANIILLGYPARVETVTVREGETWYRVQVGPFTSAKGLAEARGALNDQGIATVEIGKRA